MEQITLDGPAASGKSTISKLIAERLNANYLNTGEMYRTLTREVLKREISPEENSKAIFELFKKLKLSYQKTPGEALLTPCIDGEVVDRTTLRTPEITAKINAVAQIPEVRKGMEEIQRQAGTLGLLVIEGRDIGTVVFPDAKYKFFITASAEVRAKRRFAQTGENPKGAKFKEVVADIERRDHLDTTREISPLKQAPDATRVDTSNISIEEAVAQICNKVKSRRLQSYIDIVYNQELDEITRMETLDRMMIEYSDDKEWITDVYSVLHWLLKKMADQPNLRKRTLHAFLSLSSKEEEMAMDRLRRWFNYYSKD